jgi:hypothetical protein
MSALRVALPWLAGLAIVALLVARVDAGATLEVLAAGDLRRYLPAALGFIALWLALDAWLLARLYSALGPRLRWSRAAWLRAATYPLMALSFHLASAQLVADLAREQHVGLGRSAGAMGVHYLADTAALAGVALAGSLAWSGAGAAYLRVPLALVVLACTGLLIAGRLGRALLRERSVVEVMALIPARTLVALGLGRAAFHVSIALFVWFTAPAFGLGAPLGALLARMPIVLAVGSLPISPGGLGTAHAAMLWLFSDLGDEARILAYGLVYSFTLMVLRVPPGALAWWLLRGQRRADAELAT